jgi:hypothetical protein
MVLQGDEAQMEARFGFLGTVSISVHDGCTVCVKCTVGSEIVLDADGTPR